MRPDRQPVETDGNGFAYGRNWKRLHLPPVLRLIATALLHKCAILAAAISDGKPGLRALTIPKRASTLFL
jgi:hypothetical protein